MQSIIGWDIGGAHLKATRWEDGRIVKVAQVACPLWLGLDELQRSCAEAKSLVGSADLNGGTMTAELCDAFASREEGVIGVAALAQEELAPGRVLFYAGPEGFVEASAVASVAAKIASANWHASASFVGLHHQNALFVDMGSTTTDLIPVVGGKAKTTGYSDASRLANGELVYAGVVRSYLMSSGVKLVPFAGRWVPLMNEWFAASCDVYRLLGTLPEDADVMQTADGREKTVEASKARLARMLGYDGPEADLSAWQQLARYFAEVQLRDLTDAAHLILSLGEIKEDAPIVGAGAGRFVVKRLAERLNRPFVDFSDLIEALPEVRAKACDCAPASAVAFLAASLSAH